jgi:Ca2+-transporting ATPase
MVITDDDLATIVEAVREGRGIYDNIRKVVDYLVGGNLSEISVVVVSLLLFPDLGIPLLPLQLLWINLLTDGLPALALGVDPAAEGLMRRDPRPASQRLLVISSLPLLMWRALLIASAAIASLAVTRFALEASWGRARTVMFSTLVITHLLYAFVVRGGAGGRERPRLADVITNPALLIGVGAGLLLQVAIVAWPPAREVFGTTSLPPSGWAAVAAAAALTVAAMLVTAKARA